MVCPWVLMTFIIDFNVGCVLLKFFSSASFWLRSWAPISPPRWGMVISNRLPRHCWTSRWIPDGLRAPGSRPEVPGDDGEWFEVRWWGLGARLSCPIDTKCIGVSVFPGDVRPEITWCRIIFALIHLVLVIQCGDEFVVDKVVVEEVLRLTFLVRVLIAIGVNNVSSPQFHESQFTATVPV